MDATTRIEQALADAISRAEGPGCPPKLAAAIRYAVFPGGARIRPRLCLAVAGACGDGDPAAADAAAAAIELLHCASLVHDDLPCFDDAPTRRGRPSVHRAYGERIAVLAGDALIVLAFHTLAQGVAATPHRFGSLLLTIGRSVGMPAGIVAGQAWECEAAVALSDYHHAKTGSLFSAATVAGAVAAGVEPGPWRHLGDRLGLAYQVADDLSDLAADPERIGKPVGRDAALGRPSAARELGIAGAVERFEQLVAAAVDSIPPCPGAAQLRALMQLEANRFLPKELARRAA
jgi:geranylgeranyl diphosphate synthase, type II